MSVRKITLITTTALAFGMGHSGVSLAQAEKLLPLRASLNDLNINATGDFPYGAVQQQQVVQQQQQQVIQQQSSAQSSVAWEGRIRVGFGMVYDAGSRIGAVPAGAPITIPVVGGAGTITIPGTPAIPGQNRAIDLRGTSHFGVIGKTATPFGELGVVIGVQGSAGSNSAGIANGDNFAVNSDGTWAYWKMDPSFTLSAGQVAGLGTAFSYDANATNWFFGGTGGGILGFHSSASDPIGLRLAYADGPLGFGVQVYDGSNANNNSAFGAMAKASFKMEGFGIDVGGNYLMNPAGPGSWSVFTGAGYSSNMFAFGAAAGLGASTSNSINTLPVSAFGRVNILDSMRFELGATHDFLAAGNNTTIGTGFFYSPMKQLTVGLEASYFMTNLGAAAGDGSYSVGVVSAWSF